MLTVYFFTELLQLAHVSQIQDSKVWLFLHIYPPLYMLYIIFTINIFDNQNYFDMQQSPRRRIWVNIFLHVLIVDE